MTYDDRAHSILAGVLGGEATKEQASAVLAAYGGSEAFARDIAETVRERVRASLHLADMEASKAAAYRYASELLPEPAA
jgi:hypothetical protein